MDGRESALMADGGMLHVSILGPLAVRDPTGRDVTPTGALQRRLLVLLALRRGEIVTADAAIDALWPADPPRDATAALQNHLFRLRRGLPDGVIQSVGTGYRLDPGRVAVDADRLDALLAAGVDDAAARDELAASLARWQGHAVPELDDTEAGLAAAARFVELHARARETLGAARLAAGEHDGLAALLVALAQEHPLREQPRELLMRTLAATGRTAEALRAYDDFRRLLSDELGIEPSPVLVALHRQLLDGPAAADHAAARPARRLPVPVTALVGRDALLDELEELTATTRAVTLVGPGGVGKTRLLIALGHRLHDRRPERVAVLCELAQATPSTVDDVVAAALGIDARPGVPTGERIVEVLHDDDVVLLVDNCEHVLAPAAELVERILTRCANARVVMTSRERLRVPGEHVRIVPTLLADEAAAVDLFVERARAVRPDFGATDDERAQVATIVHRLDGLPLAIELAAARLHALELDEVAAGLDRPLALLSGGVRTSSRHSSLNAVVEWSHGLLDDELRQVFAALSVFARPFTAADVAAVCDLDTPRATEALTQLVERSLVLRAPARQYAVLETLRAFGAERLDSSGRRHTVAERHARWMVEWAEAAEQRLHRPGERVMEEVDDAVPELRAALDWLLAKRLTAHAGRLVAALVNWAVLRIRPDVMGWSERVLAADPDDRSPLASQVWTAAAYHAWMAGDMAGADERGRRAVAIAEGEATGLTQPVATMRGNLDLFAGRLDDAAAWYRRAVELSTNGAQRLVAGGALLLALGYAGDPEAATTAVASLDEIADVETAPAAYLWYCAGEAVMRGDMALARERFRRAVEIGERTSTSFARGFAGASLASMEARHGDAQAAVAAYRWLIPHWQRSGLRSTQWTVLRSVVDLLERLGRRREAAMLEGAVRSADGGHQIFGADEVALLEVGARLRTALGDAAYEAARRAGSELDGNGAAELALRSLEAASPGR